MKLGVFAFCFIFSGLIGCSGAPTKSQSMVHAYGGAEKSLSELSLISGAVKPGSMFQPEQRVSICGVNGESKSGFFETTAQSVLVPPGDQEVCIRVGSGKDGLLLKKMNKKVISFTTKKGESYIIKFGIKLPNYHYWVENKAGQKIESSML